MKKLIALLFVGVFCFSLAACGDNGALSVLEDSEKKEEADNTVDTAEDEHLVVPDAVANITPEDDRALTGILTEDSYTNEYFGLKFNKVPGSEIESLYDHGTDMNTLSEAYANEYPGILISSLDGEGSSFSVSIDALMEDQQGKTEEDLVQDKYENEKGMNEALGIEPGWAVETITLAGEEHPAYVEIFDDEDGEAESKSVDIYIIKNDFICRVSLYGPVETFDELLKLVEKIG